jgi:ketosteroid isomerase-like protein
MPISDLFLTALDSVEREGDLEPMAALFGDDSVVGNVVDGEAFHGVDGARRFWRAYRAQFGEVVSVFRNVIETPDRLVLEWQATGTGLDGKPFRYEGVSLLEHDGTKVRRFYAYFDPRALGRQLELSPRASRPSRAQA